MLAAARTASLVATGSTAAAATTNLPVVAVSNLADATSRIAKVSGLPLAALANMSPVISVLMPAAATSAAAADNVSIPAAAARSLPIGVNDDRLGPRFTDMSRPYSPVWIERVLQIARRHNISAHRGVYAALSGPTYETRAEYRMLRRLGADVVGMSTVPETTVAVHAGVPVLALSVVTNVCKPDSLDKTSGAEVVMAAKSAEPKLRQIVLDVLRLLAAESRAQRVER